MIICRNHFLEPLTLPFTLPFTLPLTLPFWDSTFYGFVNVGSSGSTLSPTIEEGISQRNMAPYDPTVIILL